MRLLSFERTGALRLTEFLPSELPPYAILSHTWGNENDEVTFQDAQEGTGLNKPGFRKIELCGSQAAKDGIQYFWVDTCCIDRLNSEEQDEAINSMYRWYRDAKKCYVFLSDVSDPEQIDIRKSRWLTRGWTLQELIAPSSVEFFSSTWQRLGDRISLEGQLHQISGIEVEALRGGDMSRFSIHAKRSWACNRQTKREEDRVYSLLGILGIYMPLIYGEGLKNAEQRLDDEIARCSVSKETVLHSKSYSAYLGQVDPQIVMREMKERKGGLFKESCDWVIRHKIFQRWRDDENKRLLWIKGDTGKGKTMMMCHVVEELQHLSDSGRKGQQLQKHLRKALAWFSWRREAGRQRLVSFFICQGSDVRFNHAAAILRGLIFSLLAAQPRLDVHIKHKFDHNGRPMFSETNAFLVLSLILEKVLSDPLADGSYVVIDGLDECETGLPELLSFIVRMTTMPYSSTKWIVSSRNIPIIGHALTAGIGDVSVCFSLEMNADHLHRSIDKYVRWNFSKSNVIGGGSPLFDQICVELRRKANGSFLWATLVIQQLRDVDVLESAVTSRLDEISATLTDLYDRVIKKIGQLGGDEPQHCLTVLATVAIARRPLFLVELLRLADLPTYFTLADLQKTIRKCGPFLELHDNLAVTLTHLSAKDYLTTCAKVFPEGVSAKELDMFHRCIRIMNKSLRRDICGLRNVDTRADKLVASRLQALRPVQYPLLFWIDHVCNASLGRGQYQEKLFSIIESFLARHFLHWVEALSLAGKLTRVLAAIQRVSHKTEKFINQGSSLAEFLHDSHRFILSFHRVLEKTPLQVYSTALALVPQQIKVKRHLWGQRFPEIENVAGVQEKWDSCLRTLDGHDGWVWSLNFSPDCQRLASGSDDGTVKVWDFHTGQCIQTFEGHEMLVGSTAFSPVDRLLVSGSDDGTIKVWDSNTGRHLRSLKGHEHFVRSVAFSPDGRQIASGSADKTVRLWDPESGGCLQKLEGHSGWVFSIAFSPNGRCIASSSDDNTIRIWDTETGSCLRTITGHDGWVYSVAFAPDGRHLASTSSDKSICIWDIETGLCLRRLEGHDDWVFSVAFSPDNHLLASGSADKSVRVWNAKTGQCLQKFQGHGNWVRSVVFAPDSRQLASSSDDKSIKIWDIEVGHNGIMSDNGGNVTNCAAFSADSSRLVSGSNDKVVRIWDTDTGDCLQKLEGHGDQILAVVFSSNNCTVASSSDDKTIRIWDLDAGECSKKLETPDHSTRSLSFAPNDRRLVSVSRNGFIKIWDSESGQCLQSLKGHGDASSIAASLLESFATRLPAMNRTRSAFGILISGRGMRKIFDPDHTVARLTDRIRISDETSSDKTGSWISHNGRNVLWLPPEYCRGQRLTHGDVVAVEYRGRFIFLKFSNGSGTSK